MRSQMDELQMSMKGRRLFLGGKRALGMGLLLGSLLLTGCSGEGEDESHSLTSSAGAISHNFGQTCTSCHSSGSGSEASEYAFTIAGSVHASNVSTAALTGNSGAMVKFYTQPSQAGDLVLELPVDGSGNFYTSQSVAELGSGLYPTIAYAGRTQSMVTQTATTGNCTSCHASGGSQPPLYAP